MPKPKVGDMVEIIEGEDWKGNKGRISRILLDCNIYVIRIKCKFGKADTLEIPFSRTQFKVCNK